MDARTQKYPNAPNGLMPDIPETPDTPNHGINKPEAGTQNWHGPLNENWEDLDTAVEIRDDDANRGDYEPKDGAKYLAIDTGAVYVGDGDSWNQIATLGSGGGTGNRELDNGTFTHTGGSATTYVAHGVTDDETAMFDVVVGVDSAPSWNGDYGFNYDWSRRWDDDSGQLDVLVSVNWGPDPGNGNDLELDYTVQVR